jgi:hypothetical protein
MRLTLLRTALISFVLLFSIANVKAQDDDVSKYFDDGGISNARAVLMLNAAALAGADLSLGLEYSFTRILSLEVDGGILLPYKGFEGTLLMEGGNADHSLGGFSLGIFPKIYYGAEAPEGGYFGVFYRQRMYPDSRSYDFIPSYGIKFMTQGRFSWDISYGSGFRFEVSDSNWFDGFGLIVNIGLRFGLVF